MKSLKRLFAPPVFDDEIETQQAYMLHIILWTLIIAPLPYVVYTLLLNAEGASRALVQAAFAEVVSLSLLVVLRRRLVRAASMLLVGAFWFFFTVSALTGNGVHGESYLVGYTLVITMAGILLGGMGAFAITTLSLGAGICMVYLSQGAAGGGYVVSSLTTWAISLVLFPVIAVLQHLASKKVRTALARATISEEKYRLISRVTSDYLFSTRLDEEGNMRLDWVAGAFESMTGYTFEEYLANGGWLAHLHPDDLETDKQALVKLKANQQTIHELRTYKKSGEILWVRVYAHPIWDHTTNSLTAIIGAVQDITERKQTEEALTQERDLLQVFLDNIPDTAYIKDRDSRFIRVNKAQADFLKLKRPEDAIGETDFDFQSHDLAEQFVEEEKRIVETGQAVINRTEFNPTESGEPRWLSTSKAPVRDSSGNIIGTIGISRDITLQKLADERETGRRILLEKVLELGKQVTEVKDLRTTLERVWHGIHDDIGFDRLAIFLYDQETNTVHGSLGTDNNGRIVEEWEYSQNLDKEKPTSFMRALEQPNGLYVLNDFGREFDIPPGHEMHNVRDFAAISAWAGDKPVAIITVDNLPSGRSFSPIQLEALRLFGGYAGLAIENSRLNAALQAELDQRQSLINELENKNAELERFTYTVSHDLKSPLVTITGFLGFLEKDALSGDWYRVKGSIDRISAAARKMQALLNDLLELSRIGRIINPPQAVPFSEIVYEAIDHVRGRLDEVNAIAEIQRNLPIVQGDRVRLVEVVQNLVENAVKYAKPEGRLRIEIAADGTNEKGHLVFLVRDNGVGIEPQYHEHIFGLFNKLDNQSEGTGIGLSLVKRIIEVHNGRIWVESEKGKGATFYFTLPAAQTKE